MITELARIELNEYKINLYSNIIWTFYQRYIFNLY
jgi:hypothetical protein